ncbi:MAG: hypothetical protein Sw1PiTSA_38760 [Shewanella algae]|uniref:hypothetical protein n=1 Tax=Shewanella algae TaxID=38313 RepID=UPI000D14D582|nr:hypothetical protein [Shewanella algae]MBO2587762.1 hypothetical protein [Shewanella algae]PST67850.1 hypothetical protein AYI77_05770 [Shewanella algae]QTE93997.1 hypothetical protein JKK45_16310 [Shewanella algae]TWU64039.1 hypothetical protein AYI74_15715 [Shewanella algae]
MRTNVRFRTEKFKLPQNEGEPFSATELADWLVGRFHEEFNLDYLDEDRYCILFVGDPVEVKLEGACGYVESNVWQVLMHLKPSFIDRLLKRSLPTDIHRNFLILLDEFLQSDPEIADIEWYEEDSRLQEFNHGTHAVP